MKRFLWQLSILCFVQLTGYTQTPLSDFSKKQEHSFKYEYESALKIFNRYKYKSKYQFSDGQHLQLIQFKHGVPLFYTTHNASAAEFMGVISNYDPSEYHEDLSGKDIVIGLWDAGHVLSSHQEFVNSGHERIFIEYEIPYYVNHSTHLGGTIGAGGVNALAKGMAYRSQVYSRDFMNDFAEMSRKAERRGAFVSNHSYGPVAGWLYNTSEEKWYWYGDIGISTVEDYKFGFYGSIPAALDQLAYLAPYYLMVISAGNDRDDCPESQPISHKVWIDKWRGSNDIREPDGGEDGYDCLGMNAVAKNVLTVGAVDGTSQGEMTVFSAWGPTDDGRIKPDISAPGIRILSSLADSDNSYGYYSGTSMSAACVSGGLALIQELQEQLRPGVPLLSSTLKGILIQTADEAGVYAGPDYQFGWGIANFAAAHVFLEENISSGGALIREHSVAKDQVYEQVLTMEANGALKATLVWTDLPGAKNKPEVNPTHINLMNDLDLYVQHIADGTIYYPWVLNPELPDDQPTTGVNIRDNVEQVLIENCNEGAYRVCVSGLKLKDTPQSFTLLMNGQRYQSNLFPPTNLDGFYVDEGVRLTWEPPVNAVPVSYKIFRDGVAIGMSNEAAFLDDSQDYLNTAVYQIAACYASDGSNTSCLSNELEVKSLPVGVLSIDEDFELSPEWWTFSDNEFGWRRGDNETLSSYYIKFDGNATLFMGINSDALGRGEHVVDYLISQPFKVPVSRGVEVRFNYFFNNDAFDTFDRFELLYRSSIRGDWKFVNAFTSYESWNQGVFSFEPEPEEDVIQLAFLYDDGEEWGSGAAIDDVQILEAGINTSMQKKNREQGIHVFVDASRNLHIQLAEWANHEIEQISVFDLGGRMLVAKRDGINGNGEITVPLSFLPQGGYLVSIKTSAMVTTELIVLY